MSCFSAFFLSSFFGSVFLFSVLLALSSSKREVQALDSLSPYSVVLSELGPGGHPSERVTRRMRELHLALPSASPVLNSTNDAAASRSEPTAPTDSLAKVVSRLLPKRKESRRRVNAAMKRDVKAEDMAIVPVST